MFNVIDLFSGCGGLSYGFEMAGFEVLLGVDNDKAALDTFSHNHEGSKTLYGDITEITREDIVNLIGDKEVDVIVGGPPCQGMSLAGPRQFNDPRNKLYLSFIKSVSDFKPKIFVIENVPGLIGLFKGQIKDSIISELTELGYHVKFQMLNAAEYGVPQLRRRVFFVGVRNDINIDYEFPAPTKLFDHEMVTAQEATSDLPLLGEDLGEEIQEYRIEAQNEYQKVMRDKSLRIYNHIGTNHTMQTKKIISLVPEGGNFKDLPEELRETRKFNVAWTRYHSERPTSTIDTGHRHHFHYNENRVPTVRENARFQSFPDHFIFKGNKTQQYRQVGNAVPPLLAKQLAESILPILKKESDLIGISNPR
ncbi:DNA cytosine methyltransferase [Sporosarcina sp. FA15]|uniref:DNA cytosine methyltransferase n=1 Tax=Sporosarcina sp. FA15 TaxID=3413031 RepID=UPI003F655642